jgi:hypothetical protein
MTYTKAVEKYEEERSSTVTVRTDYKCKAHGCPNAGCVEDFCYAHWRDKENPPAWGAITNHIRNNFDSARNWGQFSPELQAKHQAESLKRWAALQK